MTLYIHPREYALTKYLEAADHGKHRAQIRRHMVSEGYEYTPFMMERDLDHLTKAGIVRKTYDGFIWTGRPYERLNTRDLTKRRKKYIPQMTELEIRVVSASIEPGGYEAFPDKGKVTIVAPARIWTITKEETMAFIRELDRCVKTEEKADNPI